VPRPLTAKGLALLELYPVRFREDPQILALVHAEAREQERIEQAMSDLAAAVASPANATAETIGSWERMLGLSVNVAVPLVDRRVRAAAYQVALRRSGTGSWWEETLQRIAPGATYAEAGSGVVNVELPFSALTPGFAQASGLIRRVTDEHIALNFTSSLSFRMDIGKLDDDILP
jgi:hypothetical protein